MDAVNTRGGRDRLVRCTLARMARAASLPRATFAARVVWVVCLLSAGVSPGCVAAQEASGAARGRLGDAPTRAGWIGVSFEIVRDAAGRVGVMITDVSPASPAQRADLRPGDRLLAINELTSPEELGTLNARLHLRAGDPVTMVVSRDGDRRRLQLYAAPRPSDFVSGTDVRISVDGDSLVERWVRAIDSLRIELVQERGDAGRMDARARVRTSVRTSPTPMTVSGGSPDRSATRGAFDFFVFRGDVASPSSPRPEARPRSESDLGLRALTPYLLGQNRVAGAEVVELRPELAEYFDVEAGVLVVATAPGTPAALAGIRPGDVITRIDQVRVRTVDDLRFGLSVAGDALPLSIVRHGDSVQVLLTRE